MNNVISDFLESRFLSEWLDANADVFALVLSASRVDGTCRPDSDYDVLAYRVTGDSVEGGALRLLHKDTGLQVHIVTAVLDDASIAKVVTDPTSRFQFGCELSFGSLEPEHLLWVREGHEAEAQRILSSKDAIRERAAYAYLMIPDMQRTVRLCYDNGVVPKSMFPSKAMYCILKAANIALGTNVGDGLLAKAKRRDSEPLTHEETIKVLETMMRIKEALYDQA